MKKKYIYIIVITLIAIICIGCSFETFNSKKVYGETKDIDAVSGLGYDGYHKLIEDYKG